MNDDLLRMLMARAAPAAAGMVDDGADDFMRALQAQRAARGIPMVPDEAAQMLPGGGGIPPGGMGGMPPGGIGGGMMGPAMGGALGGGGGMAQNTDIEDILYFITQLLELNKATQEQGMMQGGATWGAEALASEMAPDMLSRGLLASLGI